MPTRIVLEGPQLEPLLSQVHDEYGGRARIVAANKVRTGGLAGFFARERFELSVEVPELEGGSGPGSTLLDLVESLGSKPLGEVVEGQVRFPLVVRVPEAYRASPEAIGNMLVAAPSGERMQAR